MPTKEKKKHWIVKASGKRELFSEEKLRSSLKRSNAPEDVINIIVKRIMRELEDGLATSRIYKRAYALLKKDKRAVALRYSLRQAVMQLGPTGFPFEKLVGEILKAKGYEVKVGTIMQGNCVEHEVDVIAKKDHQHIMIEAKFHNKLGIKSDLKVALYVHARFEDLKKKREEKDTSETERVHEAWLITNTKLTQEAIRYSKCAGVRAIGWNYPPIGNLQDLMLETGVHPLTCLTTLSQSNKRQLFEKGMVLCNDIEARPKALHALGIGDKKVDAVLGEIKAVCLTDAELAAGVKKS